MARHFDKGRQNEILMNDQHYNIFKVMENYLKKPNPENTESPYVSETGDSTVANKALWLDDFTNPNSAMLKYFNGTNWQVLFKDKFKITDELTKDEEPTSPIESQLWIDDGVLKYYKNGQFNPIKAIPYDAKVTNPLGFEDFLIVSPMKASENQIIDNFSEFLFAKTPITDWKENKQYELNEGAIYDLHIYMCKKAHTSSSEITIENKEYWVRLDFLNQFLVPNSYQDKFYINGNYVHQKVGWVESDGITPDDSDIGYTVLTNTAISFPTEMVNAKLASGVHVNPSRLYNITKKFIKIDKENPVIEVPENNTEFYGVQGGIGRLLIKTENEYDTEYFSVIANDVNCIKLSDSIAKNFDFIYAIHYEFISSSVKQPGTLYKKKFKLQDDNYVWIGQVDPNRICVFAQGLYYEDLEENYIYDSTSGYLYIKEKLQDYDNLVKTFDFSVLAFPKIYKGKVDYNFDENLGFRINLPNAPKSNNLIAFAAGVQLNAGGLDVLDDPNGNPKVKYIPSITPEMLDNLTDIYWAIAEVDEYNSDNELVYQMWRGRTKAINKDPYGVIVPIYRDIDNPVEGALYLGMEDSPILFVDGVLTFQKEIEIENDYLTIYGLKEGQEVVLLGDSKTNQQTEYENSDRLIFEDTVSYATVPTELCDNTIVYLQNGILCDASAVYTSIAPKDKGYNGEIRYCINHSEEQWMIYNGYTQKWEPIDESETVIDSATGVESSFTELLDKNARGYSATRKSISFLQNLGNEVCTYYAYLYAGSIEKPLLMDYCYPNGKDGVNNDYYKDGEPKPFNVNYRHLYTPGKNEITVYLNGIRQNLNSPYDINHSYSKNKECRTDRNNEFTLAFDDGTKMGAPIPAYDGYFIYKLSKNNENDKVISLLSELSDAEIKKYKDQGYEISLISSPSRNVIFYVIEQCETGETEACKRKTLTYKDSLSSKGAFANATYDTGEFLLTRGNIRVFVNGIRQPFGYYQTQEVINNNDTEYLQAYSILDSKTIQFKDILIGGFGGNIGDNDNPKFPIGDITNTSTNEKVTAYYENLDEIVIETRSDYKLREMTIPIRDNTGEFTMEDGLPEDLFKSKDKIMIYINGLAYGKEYTIENNILKLTNESIKSQIGNSKNDVITFEWR